MDSNFGFRPENCPFNVTVVSDPLGFTPASEVHAESDGAARTRPMDSAVKRLRRVKWNYQETPKSSFAPRKRTRIENFSQSADLMVALFTSTDAARLDNLRMYTEKNVECESLKTELAALKQTVHQLALARQREYHQYDDKNNECETVKAENAALKETIQRMEATVIAYADTASSLVDFRRAADTLFQTPSFVSGLREKPARSYDDQKP
jgi:hypothetical protein